jgi:hypothetical protein
MASLRRLSPFAEPVLQPIGKHPERQGFDSIDCGLARLPISEHTRKFRHFRDPATVTLLLDLNGQWQCGTSSQIWVQFDSLASPGTI